MTTISRRGFLVGCSAAIAAMAGSRISYAAFGSQAEEPNQDILVYIFLRGGCDALNLVPPIAGPDRGHYEIARPDLKIPASGPDAALSLDGQFGLHPAAAPLYDLFQERKLAIVQAVGMNEDTRSHFDAMTYIELGTPGSKSATTGWITRHLQSIDLPSGIVMPSVSMGSLAPTSMAGFQENIASTNVNRFNLDNGPWHWRDAQQAALRQLYTKPDDSLHQAARQTLEAIQIFEGIDTDTYQPSNGAVYPDNDFGQRLRTIAQIIKLQLGLKAATVDLGGWDTHDYQVDYGNATKGHYARLVEELSQGLAALYTDLDGCGGVGYTHRLNLVVMSEFGRRLRGNANRGSDHGHGGTMLLLGGNVRGGLHGTWPGLASEQLYDRKDLAVTTDYRLVLSELLTTRLGNSNVSTVFPGFDYDPAAALNIFRTDSSTPVVPPTPGDKQLFLPIVAGSGNRC